MYGETKIILVVIVGQIDIYQPRFSPAINTLNRQGLALRCVAAGSIW